MCHLQIRNTQPSGVALQIWYKPHGCVITITCTSFLSYLKQINIGRSCSCTHSHMIYAYKFCIAILNVLLCRKESLCTRWIYGRGQMIIDEYCPKWFMNSNFSFHKASLCCTCSCTERKSYNNTTRQIHW